MNDLKRTRTMTDANGCVWQEVIEPKNTGRVRNSLETLGGWCQDLNSGIGRSLSPFSISDGFTVSGTWTLFFLMCMANDIRSQSLIGVAWLLSLFIQFR